MSAEPFDLRSPEAGPRNAVGLARSYASKPDPRVRANAAIALSAIGGEEAIEALIDLALKEPDRDVRLEAHRRLLQLDEGTEGAVLRQLLARLGTPSLSTLEVRNLIVLLRLSGARWNQREVTANLIEAATGVGATSGPVERLLAAQQGENGAEIVEELGKRLNSDHAPVRASAYALLGRLRRRGADVATPGAFKPKSPRFPAELFRGAFWKRHSRWTRMVAAVAADPQAAAKRTLSWSITWFAIGMTALAAVGVAAYLALTLVPEPPPEFYPILLLTAPLIGFALSALATRWSTPLYLHFDRLTSAIVDAMAAALWVCLPVLFTLGAVLFFLGFKDDIGSWILVLLTGTVVTSACVAAVRLGSAIGFEGLVSLQAVATQDRDHRWRAAAHEHIRARRKTLNAIGQYLVGSAAGMIALGVVVFAGRRMFPLDEHRGMSLLIEGLWIFLLPTVAGLAAVFAVVDWPVADDIEGGGDRPRRGYPRWPQRAACWALILVLAGSLLVGTVRARTREIPADIADSGEAATNDQLLSQLPTTINFRAGFLQKVRIEVPEQNNPSGSKIGLDLHQWHASGRAPDNSPVCARRSDKTLVALADTPDRIEQWLGWGCYSVEVFEQPVSGDPPVVGVKDSVIRALEARALRGSTLTGTESSTSVHLRTVLNVDRDRQTVLGDEGVATDPSGVWFIDKLPATRTIEVTKPAALLARISPSLDSRAPAATRSSATTAPATGTKEDEDKPEFVLELVAANGSVVAEARGRRRARASQTPDPDAPRIDVTVQPGRYVIKVTRADNKPLNDRFVALDVLMEHSQSPRPTTEFQEFASTPSVKPGETVAGFWRITALPQRFRFDVPFPQVIRARIPLATPGPAGFRGPSSPPFDFELKVYRGSPGAPSTSPLFSNDDDPELIQQRLEPGVYELEVVARRSYEGSLPPLSPPPIVELVLNVDKETGKPGGAKGKR